ncbi:MAG: manganese catalase family protein [Bacilli bacterium]|nr:manganese catalase family protein [Bacilli bacterium]MBR6949770.1 manganese catalase family protein [Bacilli bacterium]
MFSYQKRLQYPVNIKNKDLRMAKLLVTQYGGSNGELAAALRYLNQRVSMPDNVGRALLTDIGTEELGHVEMLQTMIYQLIKDATVDELEAAGLSPHYAEHAKGLFPTDANGVPFTASYFATTGDALADISEDMAAEQKARAVYENLIDLTDDPDVIGPLLWLRQREIVHYARFKELFEYYHKKMNGKKTKNINNMINDYNDMNNILDMNNINTPSSLDITNGYLDNMNLDFTNMMMRRMF